MVYLNKLSNTRISKQVYNTLPGDPKPLACMRYQDGVLQWPEVPTAFCSNNSVAAQTHNKQTIFDDNFIFQTQHASF